MDRSKEEPPNQNAGTEDPAAESDERWEVLHQLEDWVDTPMIVLSFFWLLLVMVFQRAA